YSKNDKLGGIYVFNRSGDVLPEWPSLIGKIFYSSSAIADINNDGYSEIVLGDTEASGNASRSGLAHIISGSQNKIASDVFTLDQSAYSIQGAYENDRFGSALAIGDLDGDGMLDIAAAAIGFDANDTSTGAVSVYSGSSLAQNQTYDESLVNITGDYGFSYAGAALAFGNVNADAYDDLFIGSYGLNGSTGAVYLYQGAAAGFVDGTLEEVADEAIYGESEDDRFGWSVSSDADVNGDGFDDLLVGASQSTNHDNALQAGSVSLFLGNGNSITNEPSSTFHGEHAFDHAGYTATFVSDVNDDGYDDILIGSPGVDNLEQDSGRAYLIYGSDSLPTVQSLTDADVTFSGTTNNQQLGIAIAGLGDLNNDAFADIALSGFRDNDVSGASAVYVFLGSDQLSDQQTSSQANAVFVGNSPDQLLFVNGAGDYTGQVYSDMGPYAEIAIAYEDFDLNESVLNLVPGQETIR
ncbi:integrin alpha, partial [bacterium]|nr:integrin alpha [bacterium]